MSDIDTKIRAAVGELADYTYSGELAAYRAIWAAAVADTLERAAKVCEAEQVDAIGTGQDSDAAYNMATEHCATAIRALTPPA